MLIFNNNYFLRTKYYPVLGHSKPIVSRYMWYRIFNLENKADEYNHVIFKIIEYTKTFLLKES